MVPEFQVGAEHVEPDTGLQDPWSLVRLAVGSLAGDSWRTKHALLEPSRAWSLRPLPAGATWWDQFKRTQTFDDFKSALPFRPNTTTSIQIAIVGDEDQLKAQLDLGAVMTHVAAFTGFPVTLAGSDHAVPKMKLSAAGLRKAVDGLEQVGGHFILAFLQGIVDPRSVCTLALTPVDLYPPKHFDYVTGMIDVADRLGLYSTARYFQKLRRTIEDHAAEDKGLESESDADGLAAEPASSSIGQEAGLTEEAPAVKRQNMSRVFVKLLSREALKLCGARECHLLHCLMNPMPDSDLAGFQPEVVGHLPLSLCCICLRKLHWLNQADLLDRYAKLPPVLSAWFWEETNWLCERQQQVGMPTAVSLSDPNPLGGKFDPGERQSESS